MIPRQRAARWGLALGLGLGAAVFCGNGVAGAAPDSESPSGSGQSAKAAAARPAAPGRVANPSRAPRAAASVPSPASDAGPAPAAEPDASPGTPARRAPRTAARAHLRMPTASSESSTAAAEVTVQLPPMPVSEGRSFTVSPDAIGEVAGNYVAAGGDPGDSARFFFGDLAVTSLDTLASQRPPAEQVRAQLGNLAVSGYFGGIWLRDNLRDAPAESAGPAVGGLSTVGIRLFDALAAGLTTLASGRPRIATTAARASVPVLLTLYGYNKGYLEFLLENPPAGVESRQDTLGCNGFLSCNSTAFPLDIATRYDGALGSLDNPTNLRWREMAAWTSLLESATGAGRLVWGQIAEAGAFSPASYSALVDLSSAYLMISKAAVLSSMQSYAEGDPDLAASALLLQAGLWMWSGAYFAGLASDASRGTIPSIVVTG